MAAQGVELRLRRCRLGYDSRSSELLRVKLTKITFDVLDEFRPVHGCDCVGVGSLGSFPVRIITGGWSEWSLSTTVTSTTWQRFLTSAMYRTSPDEFAFRSGCVVCCAIPRV